MFSALVLPTLVLGITTVAEAGAAPSFDPTLQTPELEAAPYTVVAEHAGFEERLYPAKRWAAVSAEGEDMDALMSSMFLRLFRYISGLNDRNATVAMTTPVSTLVRPAAEAGTSFKMGFFVPETLQADTATAAGVEFDDRPEMTVYTRRFGGFSTDEVVGKEANELAELISASKVTGVDLTTYYVANYDDPRKIRGRRNEVWFFKVNATEA